MAEYLNIPAVQVVGHVVSFWLWSVDNAPEGMLVAISGSTIAKVALWEGDPVRFVAALIHAEFVDRAAGDCLAIHNWEDYIGKLIDQRKANAERQKRFRDAKRNGDITATSPLRNAATVPDRTQPDRTVPDITSSRKCVSSEPLAEKQAAIVDFEEAQANGTTPAVIPASVSGNQEAVDVAPTGTNPARRKAAEYRDQEAALLEICGYDKAHMSPQDWSILRKHARLLAQAHRSGADIRLVADRLPAFLGWPPKVQHILSYHTSLQAASYKPAPGPGTGNGRTQVSSAKRGTDEQRRLLERNFGLRAAEYAAGADRHDPPGFDSPG